MAPQINRLKITQEFIQNAGTIEYPHEEKKKNFNSYLTLFTKINFPGIIDLNVKPEIIKLPEEDILENIFVTMG